jgi:aryl-alcohol dehydrogenase-like predicted oxidoreductase
VRFVDGLSAQASLLTAASNDAQVGENLGVLVVELSDGQLATLNAVSA